jgi:serine/threonine protein kinase
MISKISYHVSFVNFLRHDRRSNRFCLRQLPQTDPRIRFPPISHDGPFHHFKVFASSKPSLQLYIILTTPPESHFQSQELLAMDPAIKQDSSKKLTIMSIGPFGMVCEMSDSIVIKLPLREEYRAAFDIECKIYQRLGTHPSITRLIEVREGRLLLEHLQCPLRKRLEDLHQERKKPSYEQTLLWAQQITDGLSYLHSKRVLQVDIGAHNILLDWNNNVKLCDFAGSSIDDSEPTVYPGIRFSHPKLSIPSIEAELFALGSLLYEIETTRPPYYGKKDSEVPELYSKGHFPEITELLLGYVIQSCWQQKYYTISQVSKELRGSALEQLSEV